MAFIKRLIALFNWIPASARMTTKIIMTDSPAKTYNLLSLFGMDSASDEEKEVFLGSTTRAVLARVVERIEGKLPVDKMEEFHRLFDTNAIDEEKAAFVTTHIPDFKDILAEELQRFNREAIARRTDPIKE